MSKILSGKIVADKIISDLSGDLESLKAKNIKPNLAVILVGDDLASKIYIEKKQSRVEGLGLGFNLYEFLPSAFSEQVIELIDQLNQAEHIDGILVQLPLPRSFEKEKIIKSIDSAKDIDGLVENSKFISPTAQAILEILNFYKISISGKKVIVIGKGDLAGKPFSKLAKENNANVVNCDKKTKNLKDVVKKSDIIVSAAGQSNLITEDMVDKDAIIIDAGTSVENGSQLGDTDFISVSKKVKAITPPKGGVGPVTIACLIKNLVEAVKYRKKS